MALASAVILSIHCHRTTEIRYFHGLLYVLSYNQLVIKIASRIIELCLRELFEFRMMQTDPNWTNFLWNRHTQQVLFLVYSSCFRLKDHICFTDRTYRLRCDP